MQASRASDNLADAGAAANRIGDDALVVRGGSAEGANSVQGIATGTGTHPQGVTGFSAESANGATLCELCTNINHNQVGVTTAGEIRAAGGDVVATGGRSPNHATVTGLTPEKANSLLTPTQANPVPKAERTQWD
ncbi:MAG: flavoredoxin [Rhodanobacteraceae bacterium]|nr:flavoredoxin [Rhodanobacteraceae bacterium]